MPEIRESAPATGPSEDTGDQMTLRLYQPAAGQVVVEVEGEVDMLTSPRLRELLLEQLDGTGAQLLALALDDITFLGTSGLAVLIEARDAARARSVDLRLACTARQVLRPLAIAGLLPLFAISPTVQEALTDPSPERM